MVGNFEINFSFKQNLPMTRFDLGTSWIPDLGVNHYTKGFCWKSQLFLATYSATEDIFAQIPEDLPHNWESACNVIKSNLHFAEEALYFSTLCLEYFHKYDVSYVKIHIEIICRMANHKKAVEIKNSKGKMLENFQYIRIAWIYYIKMSFNWRLTWKVRNRQIRICSADKRYYYYVVRVLSLY